MMRTVTMWVFVSRFTAREEVMRGFVGIHGVKDRGFVGVFEIALRVE